VSSQPLDFGGEFPLLHEFEDRTALVGFQDDLRFALAGFESADVDAAPATMRARSRPVRAG
jgi:hypothetical protein